MRHGDHGAGVDLQRPLQPGHGLGIEMVGRLVQEEQVGLGQEQPAECHPPSFTARQRADVGIPRGETEGIHGDLERAVELPGAGGIDLRLQVGLLGEERVNIRIRITEGSTHLVVAVDQLLGFAHALSRP